MLHYGLIAAIVVHFLYDFSVDLTMTAATILINGKFR